MYQKVIDPETAWHALRAERVDPDSVPSKAAGIEVLGRKVRYAVTSSGRARLLIPIAEETAFTKIDSGESLSLSIVVLGLGTEKSSFVDLVCHEGALDGVFAQVVKQVVDRLASGIDGVTACVGTLTDFRDLLQTAGAQRVSRASRVGLIGELLILKRLLAIDPSGVERWRGPLDQRHDFRSGNNALEVKCTARPGYTRISVSSIDQLMEPANGKLWLAHVVLEEISGAGVSVSSIVAELEAVYSCASALRERLARLGCTNPNDEAWNAEQYALESVHYYKVGVGFPRLVPSMFDAATLPAGVADITYSADLAVASDFRLASYDVNPMLENFMEA